MDNKNWYDEHVYFYKKWSCYWCGIENQKNTSKGNPTCRYCKKSATLFWKYFVELTNQDFDCSNKKLFDKLIKLKGFI